MRILNFLMAACLMLFTSIVSGISNFIAVAFPRLADHRGHFHLIGATPRSIIETRRMGLA